MTQNAKDWIQYGSAVSMLASGIVLSFICFFLNHYNISDSVLWYMAQALVYSGSIYGVTVYVRTKTGVAMTEIKDYVDSKLKEKEEAK